ncbi:MAG: helix-turn-helix transcriptional regulator [Alphaproteobacteria bacterium]
MISLEQFIERTNAASSAEDVFSLYQQVLKQYGYDSICYCLVTDHPSLGLKANHGIMQNYSEEWVNHYNKSEYKSIDPVLQYCFSTNRPFTWQGLMDTEKLLDDERLLMNEAKEAKLLDGVAVPIHGVNGELAAIGLANTSGNVEVTKDTLSKVRAISFQFHMAYAEKESMVEQEYTNVKLTDREREILLWVSEGKSDPVIADIIGVSYPTIRYHMNNVFHKLNVNERTLAVVKAIRHGLILPSYISRL